jgi:very-short-patch-repair endonuclease
MLTLRFLSKEDWKTTKLPHLFDRSRLFRKRATDVERKLWYTLRGLRVQGFHFRRQVPFRGYMLDFVEHSARLVVELDGSQDAEPKHRAADEIRDRVLFSEGYRVLRFSNFDALTRPWGIAQSIVAEMEDRRSGDEPKATLAPIGLPE